MQASFNISEYTGKKLNDTCGYDFNYFSTVFQSYSSWLSMVYVRFGQWGKIINDMIAADSNTLYERVLYYYTKSFAYASTYYCDNALHEYNIFRYYALMNDTYRDEHILFVNYGYMFDIANFTLLARINSHCVDNKNMSIYYWNQSVVLQDNFKYFEPPLWPINLKSCLGQALMQNELFDAAMAVYEKDLQQYPNNVWSLYGLLQSLKATNASSNQIAKVEIDLKHSLQYADIKVNTSCF